MIVCALDDALPPLTRRHSLLLAASILSWNKACCERVGLLDGGAKGTWGTQLANMVAPRPAGKDDGEVDFEALLRGHSFHELWRDFLVREMK